MTGGRMTARQRVDLRARIIRLVEPLGCAFFALGDHQVTMTFPDLATAARLILGDKDQPSLFPHRPADQK